MGATTGLPPGALVVDASFVIALVDRDPSATAFISVLGRSRITAVNFGEVLYKLRELAGADPIRVERALVATGLSIEAFEASAARRFPELKAIDGLSRQAQRAAGSGVSEVRSLSLADMACLAYALDFGLPVLTGDRHWCGLRQHGLGLEVFDFRDPDILRE